MHTRHRVLTGLVALAAGLWYLTASTSAAPPALPKEAYKAAAQTDIEFLQKKLADIVAEPTKNRGAMKTVKTVAMLLALNAEGNGDKALRDQAFALADEIAKKNWAGAVTIAKGLNSPKAGNGGLPTDFANTRYKFDLEEVMSPFRVARAGGMNLESDLKGAVKAGKIDPKEAVTIGSHSAGISAFTTVFPNDKAMANPQKTKLWNQYTQDMANAGKQLAEEGLKGAKADPKAMMTTVKKLEKSCVQCHAEFRDD